MKKIIKAERRLLITSVGAIALLGGMAFLRVSINAEPKVIIPPYPKAPTPNGYDVYLQASKMIVPVKPPVIEITDGSPPRTEKERAQRYSLARKQAWLKQNAAGFATIKKAMRLPCVLPSSRSLEDFLVGAPVRELARDKMVEVMAHEMRGNWNEAMQSRLDIVQMGVDIPRHGALRPTLIGTVMQGVGRSKVAGQIEKLRANESLAAARRLETVYARRVQYTDIMTEEKYESQSHLLETMRDPEWRNIQRLNKEATWRDRIKAFFTSKTMVMKNVTQSLDIQIANARLPYSVLKKPLPIAKDPFTPWFARDWGDKARWIVARNDAANAMWLVALALQAHKLEQKTYPRELRVLEGKYLKEIPADPFGGGESLHYRRAGDSYLLWSIGPDKRDNGGKPVPHNKDVSAEKRKRLPVVIPEGKGDFVWGKNQ